MNSSREHYLKGFLAGAGRSQNHDSTFAQTEPAAACEPPGHDAPGDRIAQNNAAASTRLSWEEQVKRDLFSFDAFSRLSACARNDEPPSAADRFRFQWFGLFYQGPGQDAFLARLRLPGGRLTGFQCLGLAEIAQELADGSIEFNAQGGLDLPGIPVRAGVELLRRLEGIGLSARGTGGDCVQAVRGGERAASPRGEPSPVDGLVRELEQILAQSREYGNLPGGCEVEFRTVEAGLPGAGPGGAASGPPRIVFQAGQPPPSRRPEPAGWPFVPSPSLATWRVNVPGIGDLEVSLAAPETVPVCLALLRAWTRQADRENREQASLANFCTQLGTAKVRALVEQELGKKFVPSPVPAHAPILASPSPLFAVPNGRLLSGQMSRLGHWVARQPIAEIRVVPQGCLWMLTDGDQPVSEAAFRQILCSDQPG